MEHDLHTNNKSELENSHSLLGEQPKSEPDERIVLNVGGVRFETWLSTIMKYPDTLLARMFSEQNRQMLVRDQNKEYFIDRNGRYFEPILEFYRTGDLLVPPTLSAEIVQKEVDYFQLSVQIPKKLERKKMFEYMQLSWKYHRLYLKSNDGQETVIAAETHNEVFYLPSFLLMNCLDPETFER